MRPIRPILLATSTLALALALATACTVHRDETVIRQDSNQCWVQVYEGDHFDEGGASTTIQGPIELPTLNDLEGKDWTDEIGSLIVGPDAEVQVWKSANYVGTGQSFRPGQRVDELEELDLGNEIKSLKVVCR
jgi:hypothetical protein